MRRIQFNISLLFVIPLVTFCFILFSCLGVWVLWVRSVSGCILSLSLSSLVISFFHLPSWFEDHRNVVVVALLRLKIHKLKSCIRHLPFALRGNLEESFSNKPDTYATGGFCFWICRVGVSVSHSRALHVMSFEASCYTLRQWLLWWRRKINLFFATFLDLTAGAHCPNSSNSQSSIPAL